MKRITLLIITVIGASISYSQVKSPAEFLGYELGDKFTRHHQVVDYYKHLDDNSDQVQLIEYGRTYEGRPLLLAFVSTEGNMAKLEDIRKDNLKRAGILGGSPENNVAIVWLSYNVHGNESNSTEASMKTIYELVREDSDKSEWLENTVVIIDPCINPDGRDRYVNFFWQYGNQPYNPDPQASEHREFWPGGRTNHYYFDLNRDWAWQTQIESQSRIKEYNKWLPHVHVDFHEQWINSPYYFAPAAKPYHEQITQWQSDFQVMIGKNNARYFDKNDWLYFTKQAFDLLYPSYGDTYPTYNGAIGMTYEQAGHGRAGLGIVKQEGDTLTLLDRLTHHYTTGLSTIEATAQNAATVLSEFENYFDTPVKGEYKTFVVKSENADKLEALAKWLDMNGIQYGTATASKLNGYNYSTQQKETFSVSSKDLVVSTKQPKGRLAKILFEPDTYLEDSLTYDITAWAVPYIYGVQGYATSAELNVQEKSFTIDFDDSDVPEDVYAFLFKWDSFKDAQFLAEILKNDIKVRFTNSPFTVNGKSFDRGSLLITERDNGRFGSNFYSTVTEIANNFQRSFEVAQTGFVDRGPDFGSGDISYLKKPTIAMIGGEGTNGNEFGAMWYYFEQELNYPVTVVRTDYMNRVDLDEYNVLVMQEGRYSDFGENEMNMITDWVSNGGKLILFQDAINKFIDTDYASISRFNSDREKREFEDKREEISEEDKLKPYAESSRRYARNMIPGAIYKVKIDNTHPLAYGYGNTFFSLKTSSNRVAYLNNQNVGVIRSRNDHVSGFAGQFVKDAMVESLVFGVENKGGGQIVYFVDNVQFRAFWYSGKLMMANALFFVGQ